MGDCAAQGQCKTLDQSSGCTPTATCGAIESLCGCDGTQVMSGCGYDGLATGPTPSTPSTACMETDSVGDGGEGPDVASPIDSGAADAAPSAESGAADAASDGDKGADTGSE
jgi:hypothetical protein